MNEDGNVDDCGGTRSVGGMGIIGELVLNTVRELEEKSTGGADGENEETEMDDRTTDEKTSAMGDETGREADETV